MSRIALALVTATFAGHALAAPEPAATPADKPSAAAQQPATKSAAAPETSQGAPATPPPFTWTLRANAAVAIAKGHPIPVAISVGPVKATGVTVLHTALVEKVSKVLLAPAGLTLCSGPDPKQCKPLPDLPANSATQAWLVGATSAGVYEGSVTLAAAEKPAGDAIPMTVSLTSGCLQAWGVVTILLGVVLAWAGTSMVRHLVNRAQLELPAALAREALEELSSLSKGAPNGSPPLTSITTVITGCLKDLQLPALEAHGLPGRVPPLTPLTEAALNGYRAYVKVPADWAAMLGVLFRQGLDAAWKALAAAQPHTPARSAALTAITSIDQLAQRPAPLSADDTVQLLQPILATLAPPPGPALKGGPVAPPPAQPPRPTPQELIVSISRLGLAGWAFVLLATTVGGSYVLVLGPNALGFGTPLDFLNCLVWGFGLPTGAQLLQATTGSISTSFGMSK